MTLLRYFSDILQNPDKIGAAGARDHFLQGRTYLNT